VAYVQYVNCTGYSVKHFYVGAENSKAMQFQKFIVVFEQKFET
jgi:hypothetical protein